MTDQVDTSQLVGSSATEAVPPVVPAAPKKARRAPSKKRRAATAKAADAGKERSKGAVAAKKAEVKATAAAIVEGTAAYEAAKLNQVETYEDLPANIEAFQLRFASLGAFVHGAIDVNPSSLGPAGAGRVTYTADVDFNAEGAPARVTEAWLIASNGEAVCCDLGVGLTVGGGHHAKVPASHLLF